MDPDALLQPTARPRKRAYKTIETSRDPINNPPVRKSPAIKDPPIRNSPTLFSNISDSPVIFVGNRDDLQDNPQIKLQDDTDPQPATGHCLLVFILQV